ncbi:MAG: hypothetical protein M3094_00750 [Actinomycetia bacterium]|nr:hypothetical protein [Actinomycetes bacterium]
MSRADKKITPGRLDGPVTPSRGRSWSKYGRIETVEALDGDTTEVIVDLSGNVDQDGGSTDESSKYAERSFGAQLPPLPEDDDDVGGGPEPLLVTGWVSERSIDGRTYRRHDELVTSVVEP